LPRALDNFFGDLLHPRDFFVRGVETSVGVQIADHGDRGILHIAIDGGHVELPLEMFRERWWARQKLFEGGSVFLVFDLLRLVTRIEIVLKLASEIDLFEGIALSLVRWTFIRNTFFRSEEHTS